MLQKQFIDWRQNWLSSSMVRIFVKTGVTICLTLGILGIFISNAQAVVSNNIQKVTAPDAIVYRSPDCSCCHRWIDHLKTKGFAIKDFPTNNIEAVKQKYNLPDNLTSCHTAIVDGYVIEGHVPAEDIKSLLQEKPNLVGLSVPQMPVGTPGMEIGNRQDPFTVFSFDHKNKVAVFNKYSAF